MTASLRRGAAAWWRLGPVTGTRTALKIAAGVVRPPVRRARLGWRRCVPGRATFADALGGDAVSALRGPVLAALPAVAALEHRLKSYPDDARRSLLERADAICAHRFDLLGSGPSSSARRSTGTPTSRPAAAGRCVHISQVPIVFGDGSDIKVPWELTRFQHLPLLAAAHRLTDDRATSTRSAPSSTPSSPRNPVEFGPNWACTMDVAIRAANWVAALAMVAEARPPWLDRARRVAAPARPLHPLAPRVGRDSRQPLPLRHRRPAAGRRPVLAAAARAARWARWGARELVAEMEHQVRPDGCDHEASIPYHGLVTELFVAARKRSTRCCPTPSRRAYRERLDAMLRFTAAYTRPDGDAPMVGDNDSGRFLPLDAYGDGYRSHRHLLRRRARAPTATPRSLKAATG